jgi:osmotically inducible lipoprotein OsmB
MKTKLFASVALAASLLAMGGCANMDRHTANTVGGAVIGGVAGGAVGGTAGAVLGAGAGAYIGNEASKR